jgi:hypothetical protein
MSSPKGAKQRLGLPIPSPLVPRESASASLPFLSLSSIYIHMRNNGVESLSLPCPTSVSVSGTRTGRAEDRDRDREQGLLSFTGPLPKLLIPIWHRVLFNPAPSQPGIFISYSYVLLMLISGLAPDADVGIVSK